MKNEIFNYNGNPITFQIGEATMVNATEMAKPFGKVPKDWLRTKPSKEFIKALSSVRHICPSQLVVVNKGNSTTFNQGTWFHEDVALEFARWLSPSFAIWCNDRIKEILKHGITAMPGMLDNALNDPDSLIKALTELKEARLKVSMAENKISALMSLNHPVSQSYSMCMPAVEEKTYTTKEIAKELGMTSQALNKELSNRGIISQYGDKWIVTPEYSAKGYMGVRIALRENRYSKKTKRANLIIEWTDAGRAFVKSVIKK